MSVRISAGMLLLTLSHAPTYCVHHDTLGTIIDYLAGLGETTRPLAGRRLSDTQASATPLGRANWDLSIAPRGSLQVTPTQSLGGSLPGAGNPGRNLQEGQTSSDGGLAGRSLGIR